MEQTRGMLMMHPIGGGGGGGGAQIGDDSVQLPQMVGAPRHDLGYEPTSQDACRGYHHQTDPRG